MALNLELDKSILDWLEKPEIVKYFADITRGVERESLRVNASDAKLSTKDHPKALGSALTHPSITTDFSETLIELVTPPTHSLSELKQSLYTIHQFVHQHLDHELLWPASMPGLIDAHSIRLAEYGKSNIAKMKHIYRRGLCYRYGKMMQVIAGIHYNFSLPKELFAAWHNVKASKESVRDFTDAAYFSLMRNYFRHYWLLIYLFGASPICSIDSLPKSRPEYLQAFDKESYYAPYATSLRMSGLGYNNSSQACIWVSRDDLHSYVKDILAYTEQPYPDYEKFGVRDEQGNYRQLNSNLLQIENEYYSPIRPKQVIRSGERPALALQNRGVEYIEVRCLDVNPFSPVGIDNIEAAFIDVFLVFCLFSPSEHFSKADCKEQSSNLQKIVIEGRRPGLLLEHQGKTISMREWADALFASLSKLAKVMDKGMKQPIFAQAVETQYQKILDSDLTPSVQLLNLLQEKHLSFQQAMVNQARHYADEFKQQTISPKLEQQFNEEAALSWIEQQKMEQGDTLSFEQFLQQYFSQGK